MVSKTPMVYELSCLQKFVGLGLTWHFQIEHLSNKIDSRIFALSQIKNIKH